jgi:hypothetical protein
MDNPHAHIRLQQRSVPPLILDLLILYGEKKYQGNDKQLRFFSKKSRRKMNADLGKVAVGQLGRLLNSSIVTYKDGSLVTAMRKRKRVRDK